MSKSVDVQIEADADHQPANRPECHEEGVDVPYERISPEMLDNLIAEFVTRVWEEFGDSPDTLEAKIGQVRRQLQQKKAKIVFDLATNSCNIVPVR